MKNAWKKVYSRLIDEKWDKLVWDKYMLKENRRGHTREMAGLNSCHNAPSTAIWYCIGTVMGKISEKQGLHILEELEKQQNTDPDSIHYGCMRWYREETMIYDTNGAFFIQRSLLITRKFMAEYLYDSHKVIIDRILYRGSHWFVCELEKPILYYTNKILSDGAMLIGIADLTGNQEYYDIAKQFFVDWVDYTNNRGWGWGENLSIGYNGVIFSALRLAILSLGPSDKELKVELERILSSQLDFFRFYNGYEITPAIRNYNYEGRAKSESLLFNLAQIPGYGLEEKETISEADAVCLVALFDNEFYYNNRELDERKMCKDIVAPRVQVTRIFDDKYAYSWVGRNGSIGTINQFPVIEGSYQHPTWGLGWQCMPVNYVVYKAQMSYLRWRVNTGKNLRYNPKYNNLSPALFEESHYPDVTTSCTQKNNFCIAIRSMKKINNQVNEISDELFIPRFAEYDIQVEEVNVKERSWHIICYNSATILVSPLLGISYNKSSKENLKEILYKVDTMEALKYENAPRSKGKIKVLNENDGLALRQVCYEGTDGVFSCERLEVGWLIIFLDQQMSINRVRNYLETIEVKNSSQIDGYIPRTSSYELQEISITESGKEILQYTFDPYNAK